MNRLSSLLALPLLAAALLPVAGCDSSDPEGPPQFEGDVNAILENEAYDVILATYENLDGEADMLLEAVEAFEASPTEANLEAARAAWVDTRAPWEQSESFLFGPVATQKLDPSLDSWPTSEQDIQTLLEGDEAITEERIAALSPDEAGGRKGFHTIEYLLFGEDGDKTASDFTARGFDDLVAATRALESDTQALEDAWGGDDGAAAAFATADERLYDNKKDALDELSEGMEIIAKEVGEGKIGTPLQEESVFQVESKYSLNSFVDFKNNLRSIRHIYTGDYGGSEGPGLDEVVEPIDPELDQKLRDQIQNAIDVLDDLDEDPGSFREAVEQGQFEAVRNAQNAVLDLRDTIEQDLGPLVDRVQL
jgi:uncharacterized iron-regulated protein